MMMVDVAVIAMLSSKFFKVAEPSIYYSRRFCKECIVMHSIVFFHAETMPVLTAARYLVGFN